MILALSITKKSPVGDFLIENRKFLAMTYCPKIISIVGAGAFHFSVRKGKRWCHTAQITRKFLSSIIKVQLLELMFDSLKGEEK
jgi:phage pi2 protein 07